MISKLIKSADWKAEKHVPVITVVPSPTLSSTSQLSYEVEVSVGKEIPHPNTVEHHIAWIALYYVAEGSQLPVELARANFAAHGPEIFAEPVLKATVRLPSPTPTNNSNSSHLPPTPTFNSNSSHLPPTPTFNSNSPCTLHAVAYCNLHGLWESEASVSA